MRLIIKYMVSSRCKTVVKNALEELGLHSTAISLGEVEIMENITAEQRAQVNAALLHSGLELMDDKKAMLIEKIKNIITEMVHYSDELPKLKFSSYLSEKLDYNYTYLANLFSETEGTTIEHFILLHKIERVKELILYDELKPHRDCMEDELQQCSAPFPAVQTNHRAYAYLLQDVKS